VRTSLVNRIKGHWELRRLNLRFLNVFAILFYQRLKGLTAGKKLVLISLYEHIGDIIACEPIIRYVKAKYKNSHIIWGINTSYAELLELHPDVDLLKFKSLSEWITLKQALKRFSCLTTETIDLHIDERRCVKYGKKLKRTSPANHNLYFTSKNLIQAFSISAGLPELNSAPTFYLNKQKMQLDLPGKYVVFHTQSNNPLKDWQPHKWEGLCAFLNDIGYYVIEVGVNRQIKNAGPKYIDFTGKRSLQAIANIINDCKFFIGVDSGFAHMANALLVNGVVLIGHYQTGKFTFNYYNPFAGKYAHPSYILYPQHGPLTQLSVSEVVERIHPQLEMTASINTNV
jgi:heptosyltransferase III